MVCTKKCTIYIISTFVSLLRFTGGAGVDCIPGKLYSGPSCFTFLKCVEGRFFKHMWKFRCPPGTFFDSGDSRCVFDVRKECPGNGPDPPATLPPQSENPPIIVVNPQGPPEVVGFPGAPSTESHPPAPSASPQRPPGVTGPSGFPGDKGSQLPAPVPSPQGPPGVPSPSDPSNSVTTPGASEPGTCFQYELDRTSEYKCISPGVFSLPGECEMFSLCIHTMNCILKGFSVQCPKNHLYSAHQEGCFKQTEVGPCPYVQDEGIAVAKKKPSIQLNKSNSKKFFKASTYWDYMEFFPQSPESRASSIQPADLAKGSKAKGNYSWKETST